MKNRYTGLALALLAALVLGCARAQVAREDADRVLEGIHRCTEALSSISMDVRVSEGSASAAGGVDSRQCFASIRRDGRRFSLERCTYVPGGTMKHSMDVFDGKTFWNIRARGILWAEWDPDDNSHPAWDASAQGMIASASQEDWLKRVNGYAEHGEWLDGRMWPTGESLADALARCEGKRLRVRREMVDGHECDVADARVDGVHYVAWLDPACDFALRRLEYHCRFDAAAVYPMMQQGEEPRVETIDAEISGVELARVAGVWMPVAGKMEFRRRMDWTESGRSSDEQSTYTARRENIVVNPTFPEGVFAIPYVEGNLVVDIDTLAVYRFGGGELTFSPDADLCEGGADVP